MLEKYQQALGYVPKNYLKTVQVPVNPFTLRDKPSDTLQSCVVQKKYSLYS